MAGEEYGRRIDDIISLLKIGFAREIDDTRSVIRSDVTNMAIIDALESADDWVPSGELQRMVAKAAAVSERTVRARLADLDGRGALRSRGGGRSTEYRLTGLI